MKNHAHSGTLTKQPSMLEEKHRDFARRAAAEGMVLLKNEGLLPLSDSVSIALLGGGAAETVKGGTGSGDVNNRKSVSIYEGLKVAGAAITSENWLMDYRKRYAAARNIWKEKILADAKEVENPFDAYAANSFSMPEGQKISAEDIKGAQTAVYVISRISGEGKDRRLEEGDYYLSKKEREDILFLNQSKIPTVLILNTGAPVELKDILEEAGQIKAILYISLPGQEGGTAVADVLYGRAFPGGRLTATWAGQYEDYPSAKSFGYLSGDLEKEEYREGIYVGYRYFDSFEKKPLFPFGYGLSYTTFSIEPLEVKNTEDGVEVTAAVKNTGKSYAGREVVQIYVTLPQNGGAKEYQRLAGFKKTKVLLPGEEERLAVTIDQKSLASYSEQQCGWVIEAGVYGVWVKSNADEGKLTSVLTIKEQTVIQKTESICQKKMDFTEIGLSASAKKREKEWLKVAEEKNILNLSIVPRAEERTEYQAPYAKEQTVEELIPLLYGNITKGTSTLGSAGIRVPGSAGETTEALEDTYGIRSLIMADGPAGLRLRQSYEVDRGTDMVYGTGVLGSLENGFLEAQVHHENADIYYQYCTAFPVGTALAQTWDIDLMKQFGEAVAAEMEEFHVDLWLAPGMNIQRNPLCGRNFEYYSEDPFLTGMMAAAVTDGVQNNGRCGVTLKHFVCNNQEDNRMAVDSCITERALREIYLKGFEMAVKIGSPAAIMSSYNKINGVHAANSRDLCTTVAREEWGFEGIIISDWNTTVPEDGSIPWECAAAGNDIIMPGNQKDEENIRRAYKKGELSEEEIRRCAGRILRVIRMLSNGKE